MIVIRKNNDIITLIKTLIQDESPVIILVQKSTGRKTSLPDTGTLVGIGITQTGIANYSARRFFNFSICMMGGI